MRGHSIRPSFSHTGAMPVSPVLHKDTVLRILTYLVGCVMTWCGGFMFTFGWHWATIGHGAIAMSCVDGVVVLAFVAIGAVIFHLMGKRVHGIGLGSAIGIGAIVIVACGTIGLVSGCFWDGLWGNYPDTTGVGNRMLNEIQMR